jgi:hypothetical protein
LHKGVNANGTFKKEKGAVITEGCLRIFRGQGCGMDGCNCSDGYSILLLLPRDKKGNVRGINIVFDNIKELDAYMSR